MRTPQNTQPKVSKAPSNGCAGKPQHEDHRRNVPALRFPEFTDEWENIRLGDIADIVGGGTPDTNNKLLWDGGIQWFTPSEVGKCKYVSNSLRTISCEGLKKSSAKVLPKGSILLSSRATIGECSINTRECATNQGFQSLVPNNKSVNEYIYYSLQTKRKEFIRKACGSTFLEISAKEIRNITLNMPSAKEQIAIGNFFALLDERIATQVRIIERLETLISGISNKLLYDKSWKKVYLRNIMSFYSTNSLSWDKLTTKGESETKNLHYGIIHHSISTYVDIGKLPRIKSGSMPTSFELCQDGDIAFADASEDTDKIAKAVEFRNVSGANVICGLHTIHGRDCHNTMVEGFKGYVFNTNYFHRQIRKMAQGTKVFSVSAYNISNCYIYVPSKDVQISIVKLLDMYSLKIQTENELLSYYIRQKQYLLRQMYI